MSRRLTRAIGCGLTQVVVIVVVLLSSAATAGAHATLLATEPAAEALSERAPSEVVLRFDEPVNVELGGGVRVFGPSGDRVDRLSTELRDDGSTVSVQLDGAAPGTYTVAWRVTSGDAHVRSGAPTTVRLLAASVAKAGGGRVYLDSPLSDRHRMSAIATTLKELLLGTGVEIEALAMPAGARTTG